MAIEVRRRQLWDHHCWFLMAKDRGVLRCGGVTSKAVIIALSMAMLVCSMSGVRPKVPGRKRGCLLVVVLVGTVSPSGSSGMVESL